MQGHTLVLVPSVTAHDTLISRHARILILPPVVLTRSYSFSLYQLNGVYGNTGLCIAAVSYCFLY